MMHTAEWNSNIDIRNKRVAVIGSGASAVQVIPNIVDIVDTLHCYQRKPPYIIRRLQFNFPAFVKTLFSYLPFFMWLYRCLLYVSHEITYSSFHPNTILHKCGTKIIYNFSAMIDKNYDELMIFQPMG